MITAPPIQEPLRIDSVGRITSPAWVIWLQQLATDANVEEVFSGSLTLQSTDSSVSTNRSGEDDLMISIQMLEPPSVNTINKNDAETLCWLSF